MKRREFLRRLGLGLAGAWALGRVSWPVGAQAAGPQAPELCLAFLADAHLPNGDERRPEAQALARAVAELRLLKPAPRLVLFAGDLAHNGDPRALALGREILSGLPAPPLMVMGEGDSLPDGASAWRRLFGEPWFSHLLQKTENGKPETVLQILGLHTAWCPGPGGPAFRVGESGRRWLARELAPLDPEVPLVILSHAPLDPIYRPWQQWTVDGPEVAALLTEFRQVLCLHGHTHNGVASGQGSVVKKGNDFGKGFLTENGNRQTGTRLSVPLLATAWPWPQALQGTPARLGPGLGPAGCGWLLLAAGSTSLQLQPQIWQA
jgi:Icc protein